MRRVKGMARSIFLTICAVPLGRAEATDFGGGGATRDHPGSNAPTLRERTKIKQTTATLRYLLGAIVASW